MACQRVPPTPHAHPATPTHTLTPHATPPPHPTPHRSFLEESAVFLADEPMSDVEAMLWVLSLTPEQRAAKVVGLATLRGEMYDRNLQVGV